MKDSADIDQIIKFINQRGFRTWLIQALAKAFREARKNKLKTFNEHAYEEHWEENIIKLADAIIERHYHPSASISFVIFDPMVREIFAAPFIDRVVHHFLYELQGGWWDHRFIPDSYSCREEKGTLYGVERTQKMMRQASHNFTEEAYVIKLDIRGYFMSLPRQKLFKSVKWGLEQQFKPYMHSSAAREVYQTCCFLWREILLDDPASKSRRRGPIEHWHPSILPPSKSLYTQPTDCGIVIGNLTSQLVSNVYLDKLDRYIKYDLGYQYYGRYVDDFFLMVPAAEYAQAKHDVKCIEHFLADKLRLTLHPDKRYYGSIYKGVPFLGVRIYPHCLYPSNRLQAKLHHHLYKLANGTANLDSIISYLGLFQHLNGDQFVKKLFAKYGLDYRLYLETKKLDRRSIFDILAELMYGDGYRNEGPDKDDEGDYDNRSGILVPKS